MPGMKWKLGLAGLLGIAGLLAFLLLPGGSIREVATLDCGGQFARDIAFTPDGTMLIGAGESGIATAWRLPGFTEVWSHDCGAKLRSLAVLGNSGKVAFVCDDAELHLFDTATGNELRKVKLPAKVYRLAASPDGKHLAAGTADGRILYWNNAAEGDFRSWKTGGKHIHALAFTADSKSIVSGDDKGQLQTWNLAGGPPIASESSGRQHIHDIQIVGERMVLAMSGKGVLIGLPTGKLEPVPGESGAALTAAISDSKIASGHEDGSVRIWDSTDAEPRTIAKLKKTVTAVRFSPDGRFLAAASADGKIRVWPTATR
jgi:tricorn protease-like protein